MLTQRSVLTHFTQRDLDVKGLGISVYWTLMPVFCGNECSTLAVMPRNLNNSAFELAMMMMMMMIKDMFDGRGTSYGTFWLLSAVKTLIATLWSRWDWCVCVCVRVWWVHNKIFVNWWTNVLFVHIAAAAFLCQDACLDWLLSGSDFSRGFFLSFFRFFKHLSLHY